MQDVHDAYYLARVEHLFFYPFAEVVLQFSEGFSVPQLQQRYTCHDQRTAAELLLLGDEHLLSQLHKHSLFPYLPEYVEQLHHLVHCNLLRPTTAILIHLLQLIQTQDTPEMLQANRKLVHTLIAQHHQQFEPDLLEEIRREVECLILFDIEDVDSVIVQVGVKKYLWWIYDADAEQQLQQLRNQRKLYGFQLFCVDLQH